MLNFMYDSLDTVKNLKHPTKKEFINLTINILVIVVLAGLFFIISDTILQEIYRGLFEIVGK